MSGELPEDLTVFARCSESSKDKGIVLVQQGLDDVRRQVVELALQMEQPILEVGAFLESMQDLEGVQPTSDGGSRLIVAIQAYDFFRQEIQAVERLIAQLKDAIEKTELPPLPEPQARVITNSAEVCFHLNNARGLIDNAASEIPTAIAQVLRGVGVNSGRFQNWGVNRSLTELSALTKQLGRSIEEIHTVHSLLATALGVSADDMPKFQPEEADHEGGSTLLF